MPKGQLSRVVLPGYACMDHNGITLTALYISSLSNKWSNTCSWRRHNFLHAV